MVGVALRSTTYKIKKWNHAIDLVPDLTGGAVSALQTKGHTLQYIGFPDRYKVVGSKIAGKIEDVIHDLAKEKAEKLYELGNLEQTKGNDGYKIKIHLEDIENCFAEVVAKVLKET